MDNNCRKCQEKDEEINSLKQKIIGLELFISDFKNEKENLEKQIKDLTEHLEKEQIRYDELQEETKSKKDNVENQIKIEIDRYEQIIKEIKPIFKICSACNENKCIDTKSLEYNSGTQIWDYIPNKKNQIFELEKSKTKNGFYLIKNHFSGLYLGMENKGGWGIFMKKKNENNQNFKFIDLKNGFYIIENESGFGIDLGNWKTDNGNVVGACGINKSSAQQWKLVLL